jgi:branched-chain amino acid transport system substrate-binding protein
MPSRRTLSLVCVFALMAAILLAVAACGGTTTTTASPGTTAGPATTAGPTTTAASTGAAKTLKIGTIMPQTGPLSVVALAFTRAWELYADDVNKAGGVKIGNDTYTIQLVQEDSKGSAEGASTAATKLVSQDKVDYVLGAILESEMAAINQVTEAAGVLYAQANANIPGAPQDVGIDKPLQVRPFINHDDTQPIDLNYLKETYPNVKKIALSVPDIGYDSMVASLTEQTKAVGMEIVATEKWAWGTTDFVPIMTKLNAAGPDVIMAMVSGQANDQLKAARQVGFKGPFVSNSPLGADVFVATVKDPTMLTDVICNSVDVTHPTPEVQKLMDAWKAKWPNDPFVSDAVHAYDMPWVMTQIMQKAGTLDAATVVKTMEGMTNSGDLQTLEGAGYIGGLDRFGVNRVLYRPIPLTRLMNGVAEFIGFQEPVK